MPLFPKSSRCTGCPFCRVIWGTSPSWDLISFQHDPASPSWRERAVHLSPAWALCTSSTARAGGEEGVKEASAEVPGSLETLSGCPALSSNSSNYLRPTSGLKEGPPPSGAPEEKRVLAGLGGSSACPRTAELLWGIAQLLSAAQPRCSEPRPWQQRGLRDSSHSQVCFAANI